MFDTSIIQGAVGHVMEHNALRSRQRTAVHVADFGGDIQAAINTVIGHSPEQAINRVSFPNKVLVIDPGTYHITRGLQFYSVSGLSVIATGAQISSEGNVETVVDLCGVSGCTFYDLSVDIPQGYVADNAFFLRANTDVSFLFTTSNRFYNVRANGYYKTGVRIGHASGHPSANLMVDSSAFYGLKLVGTWLTREDPGVSEIGIMVEGEGNNCVHEFVGFVCDKHAINIYNRGLASFSGGAIDRGETAIKTISTGYACYNNIRCEGTYLLIDETPGPSYPGFHTYSNIRYASTNLDVGSAFIKLDCPGTVILDNVQTFGNPPGTTPKILARPYMGLTIAARGLGIGGQAQLPDIFDVNEVTSVTVQGYYSIGEGNGLYSAHPGFMMRSPNGTWYTLSVADDGALSTRLVQ